MDLIVVPGLLFLITWYCGYVHISVLWFEFNWDVGFRYCIGLVILNYGSGLLVVVWWFHLVLIACDFVSAPLHPAYIGKTLSTWTEDALCMWRIYACLGEVLKKNIIHFSTTPFSNWRDFSKLAFQKEHGAWQPITFCISFMIAWEYFKLCSAQEY